MLSFTLGAYAAGPSTDEFFDGLRAMPEIGGLELPFYGSEQDSFGLLRGTDSKWNHTLTLLPGVMNLLKVDERFGLASDDAPGRERAIQFCLRAREELMRQNERLGRRVFGAVQVHSAPKLGQPGQVSSSTHSFLRSLDVLREWDWQGAELLVEHCDAFTLGRPPSKGFMPIDREIEAMGGSSGRTPCGLLINWGRSAVEGRSPQTPLEHLKLAKRIGLLRGLIFSGVTRGNALYGEWQDSHAPFEVEGSVLTRIEVGEALKAAGDFSKLRVFGLKMQALPASLSIAERLDFVRRNVAFLSVAVAETGKA